MPPLFSIDTAAAIEKMVTKGMAKDHAQVIVDTINEANSDYVTSDEFRLLTSQVESLESKVDERFDKVDERFDKIDERFEKIDERFHKIVGKFVEHDSKLAQIDSRFDKVDGEFKLVRAEIDSKLAEQTKYLMVFMSGLVGIAVAIMASINIFI